MNILTNSTLLIIGSLIFAHIGFALPVAQIHYQSMPAPEEANTIPVATTIDGKNPIYFIDDMDNKSITPCIYGKRVEWVSDILRKELIVWRLVLQSTFLFTVFSWNGYARRMNLGKLKSGLYTIGVLVVQFMIIIFLFSSPTEEICEFPTLHRVVGFTPGFWSALLVFGGLYFAYLANRSIIEVERSKIPLESS